MSRVLRRRPRGTEAHPASVLLREAIQQNEFIVVPGIVMQELLSGVRTEAQFKKLQHALAPFPSWFADREDHLTAAHIYNRCQRRGVSASSIDVLIAAIAIRANATLLSYDDDFLLIKKHCDLDLKHLRD